MQITPFVLGSGKAAQAILEGSAAGFKLIVCEKPGATSLE
jgi:hypothetical protein